VALRSVETVIRPSTLKEAWQEKRRLGDAARFLAGGIDIVLYAPATVTTLIDLKALDLDTIRQGTKGLEVGATATMTSILESRTARAYLDGFLVRVLREVASPLQRNLATMGGSLAMAHPWSDVIPALLALDAEAVVFDGSERTVAVESLLELRTHGGFPIVMTILLPAPPSGARGAFLSLTRTAFDVAVLNAACVAETEGGVLKNVRIAVGGTPGLASRLRAVEELADGVAATADEIERIGAAAGKAIDAREDRRAGAEYRRCAAQALVARCLSEIAGVSERAE